MKEAIDLVRERLTNLEHEHAQAVERAAQASRTCESLRARMTELRSALAAMGDGRDEPEEAES